MGPQHSYAIAARLQQVSEDLLYLNQGTLHPALVRLEQQGKIKGTWGKTETSRDAKFYAITREGEKSLKKKLCAGAGWRDWLNGCYRKEVDLCAGFLHE